MASCTSRALGPGEARLKISSGRAQVAAAGEDYRSAHSDQRLHRGERVRVIQGLAEVEFSDDRVLELRAGSEVQVLAQPEVLAGDVLATAKDTQLIVNGGNAEARVRRGAAHVTRGLAATAASYTGGLVLSSAGRELTVPALRQAAVPGPGLVPAAPTPLDYKADNPWDVRFLGEAIELGDELQARSQGFTAQLGEDEGRTAGFYRQLVPALERESAFNQELLAPTTTPGDTLVGAAITVEGKERSFADRWQSVFAFRNEGARWGLVALDQRVSRGPLLTQVDEALGRRSVGTPGVAAPAATERGPVLLVPPAATAPAGNTGSAPPGDGGGTPPAPPSGGGGGGPTTPPVPTPTVPPLLPPLLPGPGDPPPNSPPSTTPGPVEGLIQGLGNAVSGLLGGLLSPRS
jgi:hypothetical protein